MGKFGRHGWWSGQNSHRAGLWSALRCPTPKICDFASCLQWTFALIEMSKPRINFWCRALLMLPTTPVCAGRQDKSWLISAKYFQQRQRNVYLSFFYFHPYSKAEMRAKIRHFTKHNRNQWCVQMQVTKINWSSLLSALIKGRVWQYFHNAEIFYLVFVYFM